MKSQLLWLLLGNAGWLQNALHWCLSGCCPGWWLVWHRSLNGSGVWSLSFLLSFVALSSLAIDFHFSRFLVVGWFFVCCCCLLVACRFLFYSESCASAIFVLYVDSVGLFWVERFGDSCPLHFTNFCRILSNKNGFGDICPLSIDSASSFGNACPLLLGGWVECFILVFAPSFFLGSCWIVF